MHLFNGPILSSRILTAISVISILLASAALLERNTLLSFLLLLLFFLQAHLGHPLQPALFSKVNQLPPWRWRRRSRSRRRCWCSSSAYPVDVCLRRWPRRSGQRPTTRRMSIFCGNKAPLFCQLPLPGRLLRPRVFGHVLCQVFGRVFYRRV